MDSDRNATADGHGSYRMCSAASEWEHTYNNRHERTMSMSSISSLTESCESLSSEWSDPRSVSPPVTTPKESRRSDRGTPSKWAASHRGKVKQEPVDKGQKVSPQKSAPDSKPSSRLRSIVTEASTSEQKPSATAVKPDGPRTALQPQSAGKQSSAAVKPPSTPVKSPSSAVKPSRTAVKPSSTAVKPSSAAVKPSSTAVKPSNTAVKPSSTAVIPLSPAEKQPVTPLEGPGKPSSSAVKPDGDNKSPDAKPIMDKTGIQLKSPPVGSSRITGATVPHTSNVPSRSAPGTPQKSSQVPSIPSQSIDQGSVGLTSPTAVAGNRRSHPQPRTATSSPMKRDSNQRIVKWVRKLSDPGAASSTAVGEGWLATSERTSLAACPNSPMKMPVGTNAALIALAPHGGDAVPAPVSGNSNKSTPLPGKDTAPAESAVHGNNEVGPTPDSAPGKSHLSTPPAGKVTGVESPSAPTTPPKTESAVMELNTPETTPVKSTGPHSLTVSGSILNKMRSQVKRSPFLQQKLQEPSSLSEPPRREKEKSFSVGSPRRKDVMAMRRNMQLLAEKSPLLQEKRQVVVGPGRLAARATSAKTGDSGPRVSAVHIPNDSGTCAREAESDARALLPTEGENMTVVPMVAEDDNSAASMRDTSQLEKHDCAEVALLIKESMPGSEPETIETMPETIETTQTGQPSMEQAAKTTVCITDGGNLSPVDPEPPDLTPEVIADDGLTFPGTEWQESASPPMIALEHIHISQLQAVKSKPGVGNPAAEAAEGGPVSGGNAETNVNSDTEKQVVARPSELESESRGQGHQVAWGQVAICCTFYWLCIG